MSHALTIDTLAYAKKLKAAGFSDEQAEAQVEVIAEIIDSNLATKQDIKELEYKIEKMEMQLTIRLGLMLAGGITIIGILVALF